MLHSHPTALVDRRAQPRAVSSDVRSLEKPLVEHDDHALEALRAHLADLDLPWSDEKLRLGRLLARYEDQRGWRDKSRARYQNLLWEAEGNAPLAQQITLICDQAESDYRWSDVAALEKRLASLVEKVLKFTRGLEPYANKLNSKEALQAALPTLKEMKLAAPVLRLFALLATEQHEIPLARDYAEQSFELSREAEDAYGQSQARNTLAYIAIIMGSFLEANTQTGHILGASQSMDPFLQAEVLSNHGYALRRLEGEYAALPFYEETIKIHVARRDPLAQSRAIASLGHLYTAVKRIDEAEVLYNRGIALLDEAGASDQASVLLNNLANLQFKRGNYELALVNFDRALSLDEKYEDLTRQAITSANIGFVYDRLNQEVFAADWWEHSATLYTMVGMYGKAADSLELINNRLSEEDPDRANTAAERASKLAKEAERDQNKTLDDAVEYMLATLKQREITPQALFSAIQAVAVRSRGASNKARGRALTQVVNVMPRLNAGGVALLTMACGELVELGAQASVALGPVIACLKKSLAGATAYAKVCRSAALATGYRSEQDDYLEYVKLAGPRVAQRMPEEEQAWQVFELPCKAAVSILARVKMARRSVRADKQLLNLMAGFPAYNRWLENLKELLRVIDDEEIVVLHPGLAQGYRVRVAGIGDNFQLHTLLCDALIGDPSEGWLPGSPTSPRVAAAARSSPVHPSAPTAVGQFELVSWQGLKPGGILDETPTGAVYWIQGERTPADIPAYSGTRIVLLGRPVFARAWFAGRRFPTMTGELEVTDKLDPMAVAQWLGRITMMPR